jgi:1-acyl-sn-glycerol-3-phosphate acyltransferase
MAETTPQASSPKGSFLKWFLGDRGARWGTDPGEYNPTAVEETVSSMGRLFGDGCYFGLEIQGWENVPATPAMLVSNHSGGTTIPDVWGLLIGWYRHFGTQRPIHPLAHEIILGTEVTARYFSRRGVLKANPAVAADVLTRFRRDLLVMPGGDLDTWRPYSERYSVRFGGRRGYARLALRSGVPVVPVANAGAHETLFVLTDGRKIARALGLYDVARAEIFPVHLSLPWGLAFGPLPHLPTPARLRYKIGKPVELPPGAVHGQEPTDEQAGEYAARVESAVQGLLNQLRADDEVVRAHKATARHNAHADWGKGTGLSGLSQAFVSGLRASLTERFS